MAASRAAMTGESWAVAKALMMVATMADLSGVKRAGQLAVPKVGMKVALSAE
jgi:hypothetical protein